MAIDYGSKRIGIAVSDDLQIIASALQTVNTNEFWHFLTQYLSKEKVCAIIVGDPKKLDGTDNEIKIEILKFTTKFAEHYPNIPVIFFDERFTSKIAFQSMISSGYKKKERSNKANIDRISATILLQDYMQSKK